MSGRTPIVWVVGGLLALALFLRLYGIDFDPYHPDEHIVSRLGLELPGQGLVEYDGSSTGRGRRRLVIRNRQLPEAVVRSQHGDPVYPRTLICMRNAAVSENDRAGLSELLREPRGTCQIVG